MADFTSSDLQNLIRTSFPLLDNINPNMEYSINQIFPDNQNIINCQNFMPFFSDSFLAHQVSDFPINLTENFPAVFQHQNNQSFMEVSQQSIATQRSEFHEITKKRKAIDVSENSTSMNSSPQVSESGVRRSNMNSRRGKRVKVGKQEEEKAKEVVHVRARRGQATDSHSLAERVRRGKINERLKCLRDIVPGCYKTMGMAVMLDEIINYVQSLQNQVEFLSMKLTAASRYYDFNADTDDVDTIQRAKAIEAKDATDLRTGVMMMREGYGGIASSHSRRSH